MDLLTLVELSLGSQAHSGIVNFNYLHELLVQIVLRLNNEQLVADPDAIVTSAVQAGLLVAAAHDQSSSCYRPPPLTRTPL